MSAASRCGGPAAERPSRTPMSAARSPRVICGGRSIARYSAGRRRELSLVAHRVELRLDRRRRARLRATSRTRRRARRGRPRSRGCSPICASDAASAGSSSTAFRRCSSAASASSLLPLDRRELAIQKRAVRRRRDRRGVQPRRPRRAGPPRRVARVARSCCDAAELAAPRPAGDVGQRRVGGERRFERRHRVGVAVQRHQRLPASDERRARNPAAARARDRNARSAAFGLLPRELHVAERRLGRIERRASPSATPRAPARRSSGRPPAGTASRARWLIAAARVAYAGWHRRLHELGELRRRDDRHRHRLRRARARDASTRSRQQRATRQHRGDFTSTAVTPCSPPLEPTRPAGAARRRRSTPRPSRVSCDSTRRVAIHPRDPLAIAGVVADRTSSVTRRTSSASRDAMVSTSSSMPSPRRAPTRTAPPGPAPAAGGARRRVSRSHLVVHLDAAARRCAPTSSSTCAHGGHAALAIGRGRIDDVQDEIGLGDLFERRAKRRDQRVRQPIDEADRVGHQQLAAVGQPHLPHERIERDEQRVRRLGVRRASAR